MAVVTSYWRVVREHGHGRATNTDARKHFHRSSTASVPSTYAAGQATMAMLAKMRCDACDKIVSKTEFTVCYRCWHREFAELRQRFPKLKPDRIALKMAHRKRR